LHSTKSVHMRLVHSGKPAQKLHQFFIIRPTAQRYGFLAMTSQVFATSHENSPVFSSDGVLTTSA
jgi:hypothetical protein